MEQKLYAECARMGEKIPYWTVGGVYEEDYAKRHLLVDQRLLERYPLAALSCHKNELYLETARKMKIYWIRPFTASSAFTTIPVSCGSTALSLITASQVPKKPKSAASMQPLFWPEDTIQTENLSGHGILNV